MTDGLLSRLRAALVGSGAGAGRRRVAGRPGSATGASSFHLWWEMPSSGPLVEVSAVLEVVAPPAVPALHFWALQLTFADGDRLRGVGHTGLQWNRRYPGSTAINWGGYGAAAEGGDVLRGSGSPMPGFADDANTFAYPWVAGRRYRLRVYPAVGPAGDLLPGVWRGEVEDLAGGTVSAIRDLYGGGDRLLAPVVWSEVFADCDAPSVQVRWSELGGRDASGATVRPRAVRVTYQPVEDGGCSNTSISVDGMGLVQATNVARVVPHGAVLAVPVSTATA